MAKTISAEELQLRKRARRRLIGAIALVTIVAVFLPMFLDHEPKQNKQDISIQIPSPDAGTFTSKIVPMAPGTPAPKSQPRAAPEAPAKAPPPAKAEVAQASPAKPDVVPPAHDTEAAPPKTAGAETDARACGQNRPYTPNCAVCA
jgi:DedD protein